MDPPATAAARTWDHLPESVLPNHPRGAGSPNGGINSILTRPLP